MFNVIILDAYFYYGLHTPFTRARENGTYSLPILTDNIFFVRLGIHLIMFFILYAQAPECETLGSRQF